MKWQAIVVVAVVTVALLAGCAGPAATPTTAPAPAAQTPAAAEPAAQTPAASGAKEPTTIKLRAGAAFPPASQWVKYFIEFFEPEVSKRVAEKTDYRIEWTEGFGGSVVKVGEELEGFQSGILDIGTLAYCFEPSKMYMLAYQYSVPFSTPNSAQQVRVNHKLVEAIPSMLDVYDKYNLVQLADVACGDYDLYTKFPLTKVGDLQGKKIGGAGVCLPWFQGTGAVTVESNMPEAYTNLQSGVYDGFVAGWGLSLGYKFYEVAPYMTEVNFGSPLAFSLVLNKNSWNKLPKEVQDIMTEVAKEYEDKLAKVMDEWHLPQMEEVTKSGKVTYTTLSAEEQAKWADVLPNLPNERAQEGNKQGDPGTEIMTTYLKLLEEDGYKLPRQWVID